MKNEILLYIDESIIQVWNFRKNALGFAQFTEGHKWLPSQFDLNVLLAYNMQRVVVVCTSSRAFKKKSFVHFVKTFVNSSIFIKDSRCVSGDLICNTLNLALQMIFAVMNAKYCEKFETEKQRYMYG